VNLKFWMENTGVTETGVRKNLHFDDAAGNRVVFFFDDAVADQTAGLKQGRVYAVTFSYSGLDAMNAGVVSGIK
jgi:hypothetical protein